MGTASFTRPGALVCALVLAGACCAHPYSNYSFNYAMDLPAGWVAKGAEDANPAEFSGPAGITAKLRVIARPQGLTAEIAAKLAKGDEEKVGAKFPRSRVFQVASVPLAGLDTRHYGFVYLDQQGAPRVLRFTVASRAAAAGHLWVKLQVAYPRLEHATAAPAIDAFIKTFHWVEQPVIARPAVPPTGNLPAGLPLPDAAGADVAGALDPAAPLPVAHEPPSGPAGEVADADSQYYLSLNQKMTEKDTAAHVETFRGNGEHRSEEEMARARTYGMGDILKPNE